MFAHLLRFAARRDGGLPQHPATDCGEPPTEARLLETSELASEADLLPRVAPSKLTLKLSKAFKGFKRLLKGVLREVLREV